MTISNVTFQNFVAFGSRITIDLKVNVDGGFDYITNHVSLSEDEELDMAKFCLVAKAAVLELCESLDNKGFSLLAKELRGNRVMKFDDEYISCDFANMMAFIFDLNTQPYSVEMKAPKIGGSLR